MHEETARLLSQLTNEFYATHATSFARTRTQPWEGWQRVLEHMHPEADTALSVLDVGCGTLRFERWLAQACPTCELQVQALDNCSALLEAQNLPARCTLRYRRLDVVGELLEPQQPHFGIAKASCDCCVAFGFMHHIPTRELRARFLRELVATLAPGAILAVSLWCFMDDERLVRKAKATTQLACAAHRDLHLEEGDYLLGWQQDEAAFRYCHHFDARERAELARSLQDTCELVDRFRADGKNGGLNAYLVWRKR